MIQIEHKSLTLGEVLDGDRMALSQYELQFKGDVLKSAMCLFNFYHFFGYIRYYAIIIIIIIVNLVCCCEVDGFSVSVVCIQV